MCETDFPFQWLGKLCNAASLFILPLALNLFQGKPGLGCTTPSFTYGV
jgi:hypothetical protein